MEECSEVWIVPVELKEENEVVELIPIKSEAVVTPVEEVTVEVSLQSNQEVLLKEDESVAVQDLDESEVIMNEKTKVEETNNKRKAPKRTSTKNPKRAAKKRKTMTIDDESDEEFFRQIGIDDESSLIPVKPRTSSRKLKTEPITMSQLQITEPVPEQTIQSSSGQRSKRKRTVVNYSDPIFIDDVKPKSKGNNKKASPVKAGERYALLKSWYEDCLSQSSTLKSRSRPQQPEYDSTFQCCCINDVSSERILECPRCKTWQHAECVNYDQASASFPYYCFRCFKDLPPVKSAGTVIISPEAISQQWVSEVSSCTVASSCTT